MYQLYIYTYRRHNNVQQEKKTNAVHSTHGCVHETFKKQKQKQTRNWLHREKRGKNASTTRCNICVLYAEHANKNLQ